MKTKIGAITTHFKGSVHFVEQHALARDGAEPRGSGSPETFASFQKKDYEESGAIIREAGLAPN